MFKKIVFATILLIFSSSIANAGTNYSPTATGMGGNQAVNDNATIKPFANVVLDDKDGDNILVVSISLNDNNYGTLSASSVATGTIASVQAILRDIIFTPASNRVAVGSTETARLTIALSDGSNSSSNDYTKIVITSVNDTPTITSTPITSINENSPYGYALIGNDVDGDDLTWKVKDGTTLPSWLNLDVGTLVSTFAGSVKGSLDGNGADAQMNFPYRVTIDNNDNLYITDKRNHTIRKVTADGVVTTIAGSAGNSGSTDGTGADARFDSPAGIAIDSEGNLYITDSWSTIRKITTDGVVTTIAGTTGSYNSTDGTGADARFDSLDGIAIDSVGNLYITDYNNHTIRKITAGGMVTTFAGSAGNSGSTDGNGADARFDSPNSITIDSNDNLYIASDDHTIKKITPTGMVSTIAGSAGTYGSIDGNGANARFNFPYGLAITDNGTLYISDASNTIRRMTSDGMVTTIIGSAGIYGSIDGNGADARLNNPNGLAIDSHGNLYIMDSNNNRVRKVTLPILSGTPTKAGDYDVKLILSDGTNDVPHDFTIKVTTLVKIQNYAQNGGTAPTLQDYIDAGVTGVDEANLNAVNAGVEASDTAGTDTLAKIQTLADAGNTTADTALTKIQNYAQNGGTAPTVQDYVDAGVTGVDDDNLNAINAKISGSNTTGVDTLVKIQALATAGNITADNAMSVVQAYANDNTQALPTLQDYIDAGVTGVDDDNLNAINAKINASNATDVDTVAKIQALADAGNTKADTALGVVQTYANDNTQIAPTVQDYIDAGITGVDANNLNSVNAGVDATDAVGVDTLAKVQAIATTADTALTKVQTYANDGTQPTPTVQDYVDAGVTGVDEDNLNAVNVKIDASNTADVDRVAKIQELATAGNLTADTALTKVQNYAQNGGRTPTPQDYVDAGIIGVDEENLNAVNTGIYASDKAGTSTLAKIQTIVTTAITVAPTINPSNGTIITGRGEVGATITLYNMNSGPGSIIGTTTVDENGDWSITPTTPLANGVDIFATQTDTVPNISLDSLDSKIVDNIPNDFIFTSKTDQALSTSLESNIVTITGIANGIDISIVDGDYKINGGSWNKTAGTINKGVT